MCMSVFPFTTLTVNCIPKYLNICLSVKNPVNYPQMFLSVHLLTDCDKKEKPVKIIFPKNHIFTTARISLFLTVLNWAVPALKMVCLQTAPLQKHMDIVSKGCVR